MIIVRRSSQRGHARHGWLESFHTFSFADYYDPDFMGFRTLRVINEDRVQPGQGFGTHPHRDMEIVTYVIDGALEHKDSLGTGSVIRPGELQRMSAGTGVTHSEFNNSKSEVVHLLQIWVLPERRGIEPSYEQKEFPADERRGRLRPVVTRDEREGSLRIHQDAAFYASLLNAGESVEHAMAGRYAWLQIVRGRCDVGGEALVAGDGAAIAEEDAVTITAGDETELLLIDMA